MRNLFTILRREFATYFNSPIGYIFIIVFLLLNCVFFLADFFIDPQANMRSLFSILPYILCVFIPLITMRLWAEDRKENTIEMLLTFPMKSHELVLGKYLASLLFFVISLLATLPIAIMLETLGNPDWGVIVNSYFGALLLGALFLAVGIFISGLVKDQIVAAVLSLGICIALYLTGENFIVTKLDEIVKGFGSNIKNFVAVTIHYHEFAKGIVKLSDLFYFFVWIAIFLFLNGFYLEGRNRKNHQIHFTAAIVLCLLIGGITNFFIANIYFGRIDLTEDKVHTVSPASSDILSSLDSPVHLNLYISLREDMPVEYQNLEQNIVDKLEELKLASDNNLSYSVVPLSVSRAQQARFANQLIEDKNKKRQKTIEEKVKKKGVEPVSVAILKGDKFISQAVYSSLGIIYSDRKEHIIPKIDFGTLQNLEYQVVSAIYRLTLDRKPRIAIVAAPGQFSTEEEMRIQQILKNPQLRKNFKMPSRPDYYGGWEALLKAQGDYEVKRVQFHKNDPLPDDFDTLIVINPKKLERRHKWEIARALRKGKSVFLAVQNYNYEYSAWQGSPMYIRRDQEPQINDLIKEYGVVVDEKILLDLRSAPLGRRDRSGNVVIFDMPINIEVLRSFANLDSPITSGIDKLPFSWGTAIIIDDNVIEKNKFNYTVLLNTTEKAWKLPLRTLTETDKLPKNEQQQYPLALLIEGEFSAIYDEQPPDWPSVEKDDKKVAKDPKASKALSQVHLFSLDSNYQDTLDRENLSQELRQQFKKHKKILALDAKVKVEIQNKKWRIISDKKLIFIINKENSALNVYQPGKLLVIGCAQTFHSRHAFYSQSRYLLDVRTFFNNLVDVLTLDVDLASIRTKRLSTRPIPPLDDSQRFWWKLIHYILMPGLFFIVGIIRMTVRRVKRNKYTIQMDAR